MLGCGWVGVLTILIFPTLVLTSTQLQLQFRMRLALFPSDPFSHQPTQDSSWGRVHGWWCLGGWGFHSNIHIKTNNSWGCVKVSLGFWQNAYNTRMQLRRTGSSHKRKSCSFHDVTLAEEGSMIKTMNQVRLESNPEVQISQLQCLNFRKQCRMCGRAKRSNKTSWDPSPPASWPTSYRTITTIWECTRYSVLLDFEPIIPSELG